MATTNNISFEIEGWDQVVKAIQELGDDKTKRREVLKILRRQAVPTKRVMIQQAPVVKGNRSIKYHRDNSIVYKPGNLKRAIKTFTGRNKEYPSVYVGAQAKKPQGSGYYSYFIQHGTNRSDGRSIRRKNDYVKTTDSLVTEIMGEKASGEVRKYIKKKALKLGFV